MLFLEMSATSGESTAKLKSEKTDVFRNRFLGSNELYPNAWEPYVKDRRGAYIGVGTFRTLDLGVLGNFSDWFLLDINEKAAKFNSRNLELVKKYSKRYRYLEALYAKGKSPPYLDMSHYDSRSLVRSPLYHLSDELYFKLRKKLKTTQTHVLSGSLSGDLAMPSIARYLRKKKQRLSVIDISNVMDYLTNDMLKQFLKNLNSLPKEKDAIILLTSQQMEEGERNPRDAWKYYAFPVEDFSLKTQELLESSPHTPQSELLKNIKQVEIYPDHPHGLKVFAPRELNQSCANSLKHALSTK